MNGTPGVDVVSSTSAAAAGSGTLTPFNRRLETTGTCPRRVELPPMRLIAHRGFAANQPENTLRAVEEASAIADEVELDVRRCGSGELVVIHDERIDRVTDGEGRVDDHSLAELQALDVLGTGQGVPALADLLAEVPANVGVTLDLKEEGTGADAVAHVRAHHPQTVASSFIPSILEECLEADPAVPRAVIAADDADCLEVAVAYDCDYVHLALDVCTDRRVAEAHRVGMSVNAWTVDSRTEAEAMAALGVDGVIADRWGVLPEASM